MIIFDIFSLKVIRTKGKRLKDLLNHSNSSGPSKIPESRVNYSTPVLCTLITLEISSSMTLRHTQRREALRVQQIRLGNNQSLQIRLKQREKIAAKSMFLSIGIFCLAWTPNLAVVVVTKLIGENFIRIPFSFQMASLFAETLAILSPLGYMLINSRFRLYVKRLFNGNRRQREQSNQNKEPSNLLKSINFKYFSK